MYALMQTYLASANQHNETWSDKCVHVTRSRVVAEAWVADLGWDGKRYYKEVSEIVVDEETKTFSFE